MNRKLIYHIQTCEDGLRIEQYLRRKGYSRQNMVELKNMHKSILVNNIWYHLNETLHSGDALTVHIQENYSSKQILPVHLPLDIVYEDNDLMILNKSAGMPIHPSMKNYTNSLANGLAWYFKSQNKPFVFRCTNRLDRDTSGLTIIAKHMLSSNILSKMTACHKVEREYLAVVRGHLLPEKGTISAPLSRKSGSIIERIVDFEAGESAITHYRLLSVKKGHSLVSLRLETGRTHQIRIHLKHLGFPLVGDYLYNPDMEFIQRQALHSHRIAFSHPITGEYMEFIAGIPRDMERIFL